MGLGLVVATHRRFVTAEGLTGELLCCGVLPLGVLVFGWLPVDGWLALVTVTG